MQVHIIRSAAYSKEEYNKIIRLLQKQAGPLKFIKGLKNGQAEVWNKEQVLIEEHNKEIAVYKKDSTLPENPVYFGWQEFFILCEAYKTIENLGAEDFVVLLTPHKNADNWFASFEDESNSIFIHTEGWKEYLPCEPVFPISYLVMSQVVQKIFYGTIDKKLDHTHFNNKGCMNDFCSEKSQVTFKLRTADICPECIDEMIGNGVRGDIINQAVSLFEETRTEMLFKQRFKQLPSRLHITRGNVIRLVDYQNKIIELNPLEKTVFFLFLKYPNGILLSKRRIYKEEIRSIYEKLYIYNLQDNEKRINESVDSLISTSNNSVHERISTIKRKFCAELGEKTAKYYYIHPGRNMPNKILLDRSLVSCESDIFGDNFFPTTPACQVAVPNTVS